MGTKLDPGKFDCQPMPDEPFFTLLARDPVAPFLVEDWAQNRERAINHANRPDSDTEQVEEARNCAHDMRVWREKANFKWRNAPPAPSPLFPIVSYVLGFVFNMDGSQVLLIRKARGPNNMAGNVNGIGGKMEAGESPLRAMNREAAEEAGLGGLEWAAIATLTGPSYHVWVFSARVDELLGNFDPPGAETLLVVPADRMPTLQYAPGVPTLVRLALDDAIAKPVPLTGF